MAESTTQPAKWIAWVKYTDKIKSEALKRSGQKDSEETKKRGNVWVGFSVAHTAAGWRFRGENNTTLCKVTLGHSQVYKGLWIVPRRPCLLPLDEWSPANKVEFIHNVRGGAAWEAHSCQGRHVFITLATFLGFEQKVWHQSTLNLLTV